MANKKRNDNQSLLDKLIAVLLGLPWPEVLGDAWIIRKVVQGRSYGGMYKANINRQLARLRRQATNLNIHLLAPCNRRPR